MVKGKKKGKKEAEEVPSVSGLSIADTPSTSQAQVVEDSGALGLTGAALRKYKKQKLLEESNAAFIKPLTSSSETKAQVKPEPEKPEPKPEVKPEPPKEDEPEGLGLGLGGGGKKKTKKKKPAAAAQAATTQVVPDAGPVPQPVLEHKGWGQPGTQAQQGPSGAQFPPGQSRSQSTFEQWGPQAGLRQPEPQPMLIQPGLQPGLGQPFPPMAAGPQPGLRQPFPPMGAGPQPRLGQPLPHMAAGPQPGLRQPFPPMGAGPQPRLGQPLPHMAAGPQPGLRQPFPPMGAGPQPRLGQPLPHMAAGPQPGLRQPFPSMRAGPQPGLGQPLPHMAAGPQPGLGQPFPPMGAGPQPGLGQPLPHMAAGPQPGLRQPFPPMGAGPPPGLGQPRPAGAGRGSKATRPLPDLDHGQAGPTSKGGPWQADPQQREPPTQPPLQGQPMATTVTSQRPSPASSAGVAVLPKSRQEIICKYTIPHKVLGNTVRNIPIRVITNYLAMEFDPIKVYRYDVAFKPERPKKMIPNIFKIIKQKYYPNEFIAFDQVKNCYSLNPLKNIPSMGDVDKKYCVKATITDPNGRNLEFEVSIQQTGIIDFGKIKRHMESGASSLNPPAEEIQCIDVILRQGALEAYVKSGRQFFKRPAKPIDLSGGLEMWTGLFQSAIFTSKAFINIDVAHKGFPIQQSMIQALTQSFKLNTNCRVEEQRNRDIEGFQSFVRNLRVVATLVGPPNHGQTREFICNGLVDPPFKLHFSCERNGKNITMSVGDYFAREKGYKLKYPNLNCMWVGPREKGIYYPLELLEIAYGQPLNRQLNDMQLSNMVREAATPPIERKRKIEEVTASMNYSRNAFFKKFGLQISSEFLKVEAKILTPPNLDVGERNALMPRKGSWQTNRLLKPEALVSWGFIALECNPMQSNYECIRDLLLKTGRQMGMEVAEPRMQFFNVRINELRNILFSALEKEVRFLFVIVGGRAKDTYHKVKQMAERDVGILTQCIKEYTASRRMNVQTIKNILLKVNSKLMGINQVLDSRTAPPCLKNGDVMIVGADVTHPSPDQTHIPSIAAVTASMDAKGFSYNIELSIQTPKKEMIVEFQDMMFDHLKLWRERHNSLPRKIYVFRDGVSEGQFGSVMNSELDAVHLAYRRFSPNAKPEVLFLLVQKRHHTRFFTDPNCANVEPGTVVDTHIVHPKELDFYLVSHQAIKGTARPTRYHAICNDGKIPHDQVEQLTYYLCHLYARCMRSVSYPTPTYYAHLACLRARSLTYGQTFDNASLERQPQRLRVLDKMLKFSRMFFV